MEIAGTFPTGNPVPGSGRVTPDFNKNKFFEGDVRADIQNQIDEIEQSLELLRRHL
jgi:hypothetical protein